MLEEILRAHPFPLFPLTNSQPSQSTQNVSRLLVISGNNGALSLQCVQDHLPTLYHRRQTRKSSKARVQQTHDSSQHTIKHYLTSSQNSTLSTQHTYKPTIASPRLPAPTTHTNTAPTNTLTIPKYTPNPPQSPPPPLTYLTSPANQANQIPNFQLSHGTSPINLSSSPEYFIYPSRTVKPTPPLIPLSPQIPPKQNHYLHSHPPNRYSLLEVFDLEIQNDTSTQNHATTRYPTSSPTPIDGIYSRYKEC